MFGEQQLSLYIKPYVFCTKQSADMDRKPESYVAMIIMLLTITIPWHILYFVYRDANLEITQGNTNLWTPEMI